MLPVGPAFKAFCCRLGDVGLCTIYCCPGAGNAGQGALDVLDVRRGRRNHGRNKWIRARDDHRCTGHRWKLRDDNLAFKHRLSVSVVCKPVAWTPLNVWHVGRKVIASGVEQSALDVNRTHRTGSIHFPDLIVDWIAKQCYEHIGKLSRVAVAESFDGKPADLGRRRRDGEACERARRLGRIDSSQDLDCSNFFIGLVGRDEGARDGVDGERVGDRLEAAGGLVSLLGVSLREPFLPSGKIGEPLLIGAFAKFQLGFGVSVLLIGGPNPLHLLVSKPLPSQVSRTIEPHDRCICALASCLSPCSSHQFASFH